MIKQPKLRSLTIFFPFYNDAGTVQKAIAEAYKWGNRVSHKLEVIAIHGGASTDDTKEQIQKAKKKFRRLIVIDKSRNTEGYAVIKHGFKKATSDWVFYTDGDLQYDLSDLPRMVLLQRITQADVVNGYKTSRGDSTLRVALGKAYLLFTWLLFRPPVRDTTCDFRLIRTKYIRPLSLTSTNASILIEMLKKLEAQNVQFAELHVSHRPRTYGSSSYRPWQLLTERLFGDLKLYTTLRKSV